MPIVFDQHAEKNVTDILTEFNLGPWNNLASLLKETESVISGSAALASVHPHLFHPSDIDIYTSNVPTTHTTITKFLNDAGYFADDNTIPEVSYWSGAVHHVKRFTSSLKRQVHVVISKTSCAIQPILEFHSSVVMNFIAWYGIVLLYPATTLNRQGLIIIDHDGTRGCFTKYKARSFDLRKSISSFSDFQDHICRENGYCPLTVRCLHDSSVLVHSFSAVIDFQLNQVQQNVWWKLRLNRCGYTLGAELGFTVVDGTGEHVFTGNKLNPINCQK